MMYGLLSDGRVVYAETRRVLVDAHGDTLVESGDAAYMSDEARAAEARGDVAAIAALSVSALTLALPELTLDQLEALLLVEGHTRGRRDALAAISAEIRGRV